MVVLTLSPRSRRLCVPDCARRRKFVKRSVFDGLDMAVNQKSTSQARARESRVGSSSSAGFRGGKDAVEVYGREGILPNIGYLATCGGLPVNQAAEKFRVKEFGSPNTIPA